MARARPLRIVYCENNVDGTIGGSYYSLLYLVQGLGRRDYAPIVVFKREHRLMERFQARRGPGWRALARDINAAVASVRENGYCWASWQPQVVALAMPLVVADHPVYVLNMSVMGDAEPMEVVGRLNGPLLNLGRRVRESIGHL